MNRLGFVQSPLSHPQPPSTYNLHTTPDFMRVVRRGLHKLIVASPSASLFLSLYVFLSASSSTSPQQQSSARGNMTGWSLRETEALGPSSLPAQLVIIKTSTVAQTSVGYGCLLQNSLTWRSSEAVFIILNYLIEFPLYIFHPFYFHLNVKQCVGWNIYDLGDKKPRSSFFIFSSFKSENPWIILWLILLVTFRVFSAICGF